MRHLLHCTVLLIAIAANWSEAGRPPPKVHINKCCRVGEYMDRTKTCVAGSTETWAPTVFMINRKTYYTPRGELPRFFNLKDNAKPAACGDNQMELFTGSNNIIIFSNGSLYLPERSVFIAAEDYCADKDSALVCFPQINGMDSLIAPKRLSKVRKCCGRHSAYDERSQTCLFFNDPSDKLYDAKVVASADVEIVYGFPECEANYAIAGRFEEQLLDADTGNLTLNAQKVFTTADYCLEHTVNGTASDINIFTCSHHFATAAGGEVGAVPAPESAPNSNYDARIVIYSIGLFISAIFLFATLVAGFLVPSNHHLLHWRCQIYYVFCLLVGDLLLAITQISGNAVNEIFCKGMASLMHFAFLAAFFWLNTMCFNIWWTFRDFRPTTLEKNQEVFRLRIYKIYAWGVPLIIAGLAFILDQIPEGPNDHFLRPQFGVNRCWFYGDMEILTYFFGPIGILLFINLLLFASTARQLTCGLWKRDDVKSTTERTALGKICLKLVIVMGVTWVADIVSWMVGGPQSVWYVTDLINALQGVFIFIVVGCQPQVWTAVKRFCFSKAGRETTNTTNGHQHSSSSHGLPSIGETTMNTTTTSAKIPMETVC